MLAKDFSKSDYLILINLKFENLAKNVFLTFYM